MMAMFDGQMMSMRDYHMTGGRGYQEVTLAGGPDDLYAVNDLIGRRVRVFRRSQVVEVLTTGSHYRIKLVGGEEFGSDGPPTPATLEVDKAEPGADLSTLLMVRSPNGDAFLLAEDVSCIVARTDDSGGDVLSAVYRISQGRVDSSEAPEVLAARLDRLRRSQKAEAR